MSATLVLLRHGESDWNAKDLFTGWVDVDLTDKGRQQAVDRRVDRRVGQLEEPAGDPPAVEAGLDQLDHRAELLGRRWVAAAVGVRTHY